MLFIFSLLIPSEAQAAAWRVSGFELPADIEKRVRDQISDIKTPDDLQSIMAKIGRFVKLSRMDAYKEGDVWVITGNRIPVIRNIETDLALSFLRTQVEVATRDFIDQADDSQTEMQITSAIKNALARKGFPRVHLSFSRNTDANESLLTARVDLGPVCLIRETVLHFRLPPGYVLSLDKDQVCDLDKIQEKLDELQARLIQNGYKQARIETPKMQIDDSTLTARLDIFGQSGSLVRYKIMVDQKESDLEDIFAEEDLSRIDPQFVGPDAMAGELERVFQLQGFADVQVLGPKLGKSENAESIYVYEVTSGPKYSLNLLEFEGNSVFSESELVDIMGLSGVFSTSTVYDLDGIRQALDSIRGAYGARGYWDATTSDPRITKDRDLGRAQAVIAIQEGKQRVLRDFVVNGATVISPEMIRGMLSPEKGQPLDRNQLIEMERQIRARYIEMGYLYVDLRTELRAAPEDQLIQTDVIVDVIENRRIKIGLIRINGLVKTEPKVINRELEFESGDWYVPDEIDASRRSLINLGLFRSVQIAPADLRSIDEKDEILDLVITVRESNPGTVSFGPGWSLDRGQRFGIEASYNNVGGVGRQIYARGKISEEANQEAIGSSTMLGRSISLGYLEPYVLGLPIDGSASVSAKAEAGEYWSIARSGEVSLTHRFRGAFLRGSSLSLFYGQKISEVFLSPRQAEAEDAPSQIRVGQIGIRFRLDRRNQVSWPSSGYFFRTETSWARFPLGGDLQYFFYEIENNYFFLLRRNWVLAVGGNFASFNSVETRGSDSIRTLPLNERLSIEGQTTVRGFQENSLGPLIIYAPDETGATRDDSLAKGSQLAVLHLELRRQIVTDTFAAAAFIDSGNVFFTKEEEQYFDTPGARLADNMPYDFLDLVSHPDYLWKKNYTSWGLALNYLTPIGSLNLAYGLPWNRCAGQINSCVQRGKKSDWHILTGQFHINVGATF